MNKRVIQLIVAVILVLLAGGYLALRLSGPAEYYKTPTEIKSERNAFSGKWLRVGGRITASSIKGFGIGNPNSTQVTFEIVDENESIPVIYQGLVPSTFKDGAEAVAEGTYTSKKYFEAEKILIKCPSTYLPEQAIGATFKALKIERVLYR